MDRILGQSDSRGRPRRAWWLYAGVALVILLIVAWIDGGEEPLRPIVEEIDVPGEVQ